MPLTVIRDNIVNVAADAIVIPANSQLLEGRGSSHDIFKAAGREVLTAACVEIGYCPEGAAVITPGFKLPAHYLIHAVCPRYYDGTHHEEELLRSAYLSALKLADSNGLGSIAFPLLSSGNYNYPKGRALEIANDAISDYLTDNESSLEVILVVYDMQSFAMASGLFDEIESYLDGMAESAERVAEESLFDVFGASESDVFGASEKSFARIEKASPRSALVVVEESFAQSAALESLDELINRKHVSFRDKLYEYIVRSELDSPKIYGRAQMSKQSFSKIVSGNVVPKKSSILALALALRLNIEETEDLLARAGHALSDCSRADLIVRYCIEHGRYNLCEVNEALFYYGEKTLGNSIT